MKPEEIIGYLPHKLKCKLEINSIQDIVDITGFEIKKYGKFNQTIMLNCTKHINPYHIDYFKPIFHPLPDLTKPITVDGYNDGKEFVPVIELVRVCHFCGDEDLKFMEKSESRSHRREYRVGHHDMQIYWDILIYINGMRFDFVQLLYQWHFDIHGLIEKGEAIDINEVKI